MLHLFHIMDADQEKEEEYKKKEQVSVTKKLEWIDQTYKNGC